MKLLDVLYYNYFKYAMATHKGMNPHLVARIHLGISFAFMFNGIGSVLYSYMSCSRPGKAFVIGAFVVSYALCYLYFVLLKQGSKIIIDKPNLFNSDKKSYNFSKAFLIVTFLIFLFGAYFAGRHLRNVCETL
jgi:hypothetical protein